MQYKLVPIKNQKFEIGRIINLGKCDCQQCDFMNCPKQNYAMRMKQKRYSVKEFFDENKEDIKVRGGIVPYLSTCEGMLDFMSACVGNFPTGTYWDTGIDDTLYLVSRNRSNHGPDFCRRVAISIEAAFPISYYVNGTYTQEKFAERLQAKFLKLYELYEVYKHSQK